MPIDRADIVVIGSGVAGLTAALTASIAGLRAVVLEHSDKIGGTSARSSGTVWIPGSHYLQARGINDDRENAERYLASLVGNRCAPEMWRTFLDKAPRMLAELQREAGVEFRPFMNAPDYRQDHPGAASGGRALEPLPFDGRRLAGDFARLAPPLPELTLFGGMMITRAEAAELVRLDRSPAAVALGARLAGRYLLDRVGHSRGTRLVLGNALVARLLKAATDRGVTVLCNARVAELSKADGRITGAAACVDGRQTRIAADCGVVLAGGGFPASPELRARYLPAPVAPATPAAEGCDGSTIKLGLAAGGALGPDGLDNALWFPSSLASRRDGTTAVYPHIVLDRAKPGVIAVDGTGRRFVNEAVSYHEFVRGMYAAHRERPAIPAWLICDRTAIRRYGLGLVRPRWANLRRFVASGYLVEAASVDELAARIGVPAAALCATIERYNGLARSGFDEDFGRGGTIYDRSNGDAAHGPNPSLGPLDDAPFYAVALYPTPLGTSRGLRATTDAQVCDDSGQPIDGLYVCGNDMQSAFGGEYPGAGGQLGQAMTFGWIAARHAAAQCIRRRSAAVN
jgi:succinate dehydrogenase/fumarate reductase flavoprotein subunit